jgi:uncharacterized protein YcfJ
LRGCKKARINVLKQGLVLTVLAGVMAVGAVGCQSHAGNGALLGGAAGAGIGAIIGNNSHGRTGEGAAIGAAVGAISGGLIGNEQDKAEARARDDRYYEDRSARHYRDDDRGYYREERYIEDEYGNRSEPYYQERRGGRY